MSNHRATSIGLLLAKTILQEFEGSFAATDSEAPKPAIRIAGFEPDEIRAMVSQISDWSLPGHAEAIQVVVGSNDLPGLEGHLLPPGRTLTSYRNTNDHGLVLIEVDDQSDAQGIQQMHSITDRDLLGSAAGAHQQERLRWLYEIAWKGHLSETTMDAPASLGQSLDELYQWLHATSTPALRTWVDFVSATTGRLARLKRALAAAEVREAICDELGWLNLFPDPLLYRRHAFGPRRIEKNQHLSDLRNPQGKELRDDDLSNRIDAAIFTADDGTDLSPADIEDLRSRMHEIRENGGPSATTNIKYALWEQLFEKKASTSGIGALIRQHLEEVAPERIDELAALQIDDDLDEGDAEAAELFMTAEPPEDKRPLVDLLPSDLRKKLDRLVFKGEQTAADPLIAILNGLKALPAEIPVDAAPTISLSWEKARFDDDKGEHSARLFGLLYGQTLLDVRESSAEEIGCTFEVDDRLLRSSSMDDVFREIDNVDEGEDSEDSDRSELWGALQLSLRSSDSKTPLIRFRWSPEDNPGLVLFARLVAAGGAGGQLHGPATDEWLARALHTPEPTFSEVDYVNVQGLGRRWRELASEHLKGMAANGLSSQRIGDYLDQWTPLMQEARDTLIPAGGPLPELDDVMTLETGSTDDGHVLVLATHPLRLRWFGLHLDRLAGSLRKALQGGLQLNSENDQLYFDWLDKVSPHRQPPLVTKRNELYTAVREIGLHEEFATVASKHDNVPEWLSAIDSSSIDEIVATLRSFLSAFPQKVAGLSVLILSHGGADRIAHRLVDRLRRREFADLDLELHIVTRVQDHDAVAAALSAFDSEEGRGRSLLPPFRLVLHPWGDGPSLSLEELKGRIDVAIAPNLFGLHSTPLAETRRRESGLGGSYDPWIDRATHSRPPAPGNINVSQVLLPEAPDPLLEAWSTLSVRRHTSQPVSADDSDGTDFFTLQVQFDQNEKLFADLHSAANWVVTLDPFIGRDQIDALNDAPDVITVRPGVGKNQMYTMVVSSTAGRQWVAARLGARLEDDFGIDPSRASRLATRIYEIGRQVVPGLMLRAVGLGRTVEEILGLILARYAIAEEDGDRDTLDGGLEYWVSLDEHTEWFGGANRLRPDLLRVQALREGTRTRLRLLVLESKFRQRFHLGVADEQVTRALALFEDALCPEPERVRHDTPFWQRELLAAFNQLPRHEAPASDLPSIRRLGGALPEADIKEDIRSGLYDLDVLEGVICATAWSNEGGASPPALSPGGHRVVAIDRVRALRILDCIEREEDPFTPTVRAEAPTPPPPSRVIPQIDLAPAPPPSVETDRPPRTEAGPVAGQAREPGPHEAPSPGRSGSSSGPRMQLVELERRLQLILDRLDQLGVSVNRPAEAPYLEGPGFCSYRVELASGVQTHAVTGKVEDLKLALGLPAELSIRSYVDRGAVVFEVPKDDADRYFVNATDLLRGTQDDPTRLSVPIGEDVHGNAVSIDFSSADSPHLLIAGTTGSGKSIALETILRGLATLKTPEQLRLLLVDGKGTELVDFEDSPHLLGQIGYWPDDAIEVLTKAVEEMTRRTDMFRSQKVRSLAEFNKKVADDKRLPWWLVVLDEYADLTSDPEARKQIENRLKRVAQMGRSTGIHLVLATQKPSAEVLSTVVRSNLPAQLALRVKTASDSRIILDEAGAESLAGKGDAFLKTAKGTQRIQCAMVSRGG